MSVWIGIGANQGDAVGYCRQGLAWLAQHPDLVLLSHSSFYRTQPVGPIKDQPWFINLVCRLACRLEPIELLELLQTFERRAGRNRTVQIPWGPRPLDLDLLFFHQRIIQAPNLKIPHPFLHLRRFVLRPLCDLDVGMPHPILDKTVDMLLKEVDDSQVVELIPGT
ncbi:MAG: 2-amino-4-hydroxy-6-hydroxymethyldihydropteridine diphosphokinase [Magnetococcus sp. DMHC-6]